MRKRAFGSVSRAPATGAPEGRRVSTFFFGDVRSSLVRSCAQLQAFLLIFYKALHILYYSRRPKTS